MRLCDQLTVDQLLCVRDALPLDAALAQHALDCPHCQAAVKQLRARRDALRALPELQAPAWIGTARVCVALTREKPARNRRSLALVAGLGAVLVASTAMLSVLQDISQPQTAVPTIASTQTAAPPPDSNHDALVEQSQRLEAVLALLPQSRSIERAGMATAIEALQARIQWVDFQLSVAGEVGLTEGQATELWQDRVQLLDSLIKVSNADTQRVAML